MFATHTLSAGWRLLKDWYLPRPIDKTAKWSDDFDRVRMIKSEEPMKTLALVDKVVGVLAYLGEVKPKSVVNQKIVKGLMVLGGKTYNTLQEGHLPR